MLSGGVGRGKGNSCCCLASSVTNQLPIYPEFCGVGKTIAVSATSSDSDFTARLACGTHKGRIWASSRDCGHSNNTKSVQLVSPLLGGCTWGWDAPSALPSDATVHSYTSASGVVWKSLPMWPCTVLQTPFLLCQEYAKKINSPLLFSYWLY